MLRLSLLALMVGLASADIASAEERAPSVMKQCGDKWQAAKAAGTTGDVTWTQFLSGCRADLAAQPTSETTGTATPQGPPNQGAARMSAALSAVFDDWLIKAYLNCWTPPTAVPGGERYVAEVRVDFNADGTLASAPALLNPPSDPAWRAHAESAMRAVLKCNPLHVPPEYAPYYEQWRTKTVHFDPQSAKVAESANEASAPAPAATPAHAAPAANVPTASRAAMLVTVASDPQKPPAVSLGSVVWTSIPPIPGEPATLGVRAEADIPDLKIHAIMTIRKNTDPSFAASHTIDLRVTFSPGADIKGVKDMSVPMMRREDPSAQDALAGVRVKISDSYFLVGLNHADADAARNVNLIATRGWFDFPLVLNDDRLAKLTFEKGEAGDHILSQALVVWKDAESPNAASVAQNANKPSFDCATAKSGAARLICSDAELSKADADLGKAFQTWLAPLEGADKSAAIKNQVTWIHVRDTECGLNGKEEASIETLAAAKTCILRTIQSRTSHLGGADVAAPPTAPTVQPTGTAAPPPALPDSETTKTTATMQAGVQMPKAFSMVDIFDWLTHIVLLLAAFGMLILILTMILGLSKARPVEATMRAVACACGLLLYISSKAIGLSLPDLVFNALSTSFPWKVGLAGIIAPSCLGFLSAWYVGRYLNSMDALKNVVGMRVLVLTMTFVFFLYCDSYVARFATERRDDLRFLAPNISFTIAVLLYAILRYHPGEWLIDKKFRNE